MGRLLSCEPDSVVYCTRGGGAIVLLLAVVMICVLAVVPMGPVGKLWLAAAAVVLFLVVGALWRQGTTVDRTKGVVIQWSGLLVPMWSHKCQLSVFDSIEVGEPEPGGGCYVCLRGTGGPDIVAEHDCAREDALNLGQKLAALTGLKLTDVSHGLPNSNASGSRSSAPS